MTRAPRLPRQPYFFYAENSNLRVLTGRAFLRQWRRWRRERPLLVTQRQRTPFTDAMCLPYHGGWISQRGVYLQTPKGKCFIGTLYDKAPPPPLSVSQRQRLEALKARFEAEDEYAPQNLGPPVGEGCEAGCKVFSDGWAHHRDCARLNSAT